MSFLPLVYACAGCSNAARMTHELALRMDREGLAEMSCTAGIGGGVEAILHIARSPRPRIALDGCALRCAEACLRRENLPPHHAINLAEHGVRRRPRAEIDPGQLTALWDEVIIPAIATVMERKPG